MPLQQGQREGTGSRTCQHSTPSPNVCRLDSALQHKSDSRVLALAKADRKGWPSLRSIGLQLRLRVPPSAPALPLLTVRDGSLFPPSCFNQNSTVVICGSGPGGPIPVKGGDQSGVNRELGPMPKGQPIGHNLQPASI